jgi:serine/threonine protein phosphatase PrpC
MTEPTTTTASTQCPSCAAPVTPGDGFCEACGAELSASTPTGNLGEPPTESRPGPAGATCFACGGAVAADGYCTECGAKARSERDHFTEQPATWVAAVCDRGVRHSRNEDAVALEARPEPGSHAVLVVCDGVSSSTDSDVASLAAARAARDVLASSSPSGIGTAAARVAATAKSLDTAVDAANEAVIAHTAADSDNPASCTFVAAVVDAAVLVVGWVGDSRAYWLPDAGEPELITTDDSFAAEQIAEGVPRAEAESGAQAHAITRWLGKDAPEHAPRTASLDLDAPGWVVVCSDGLWNYCSEPTDLADLVHEQASSPRADPLPLASSLVDWANAQGGVDNITVALARIDPVSSATTAAPGVPSSQSATPREEVTHDGNVHS